MSYFKRNIGNIKQFVETSDSERRSILRNLTDEQYDDILRVCSNYPSVELTCKVNIDDDEDEHTITAGALVTLDVFLKRENLKVHYGNEDAGKQEEEEAKEEVDELTANETQKEETKPKPWQKQQKKAKSKPKQKATNKVSKPKIVEQKTKEESESDLEESGSDEEANENVSASEEKNNKAEKNSGDDYFEKFQQMQKKKEKLETKAKISHRVYCPYFPDVKQECWWLYVADKKTNIIISAPIYVQTLKDTEEVDFFVYFKN